VTYPAPPPLRGKKVVARTLRAAGRKGNWVANLQGVIALYPQWNFNWALNRIDAQPISKKKKQK
jgi:hypothetical protein